MPLDKSGSKSSVKNNIDTEMKSGRSPKQALAIALSVKKVPTYKPVVKPTMDEEISEGEPVKKARKIVAGKIPDEPDDMGSALSMNTRKRRGF